MLKGFKRTDQAAGVSDLAGSGTLSTVIVRKSTLARSDHLVGAYEIVGEVVSFVHNMIWNGLYNRPEIPAVALQVYHADIYLGQVTNGGHSQFIGNYLDDLDNVLTDVRAGLAAMGAQPQLEIFERMVTWIALHPEDVAKQTGFDGGISPFLAELSPSFFKVEEETPMVVRSARWIVSWPNLRVVEDADYAEAIHQCVMSNPLRNERLIARSIDNLAKQMTEWSEVGVGLACAGASPMEIKSMMLGGWTIETEGEHRMIIRVRTNEPDLRLCVVTPDGAALYEYVEGEDSPIPGLVHVDGMAAAMNDGRLARYAGPSAGRKLSHVSSKMIAAVIDLSKQHHAPVALDLLLRMADIDPDRAVVSPISIVSRPDDTAVHWTVAAGGQRLLAKSIPDGIVLTSPDDERILAIVRASEISQHAARAETGGAGWSPHVA